jgi:hypothetical protein
MNWLKKKKHLCKENVNKCIIRIITTCECVRKKQIKQNVTNLLMSESYIIFSHTNTMYSVVSAPGKVLMTGGYLVLEKEYSGLVLASSSRFYSHIASPKSYNDISSNTMTTIINLHSPQFYFKTSFKLNNVISSENVILERSIDASENKYIEYSLLYSVAIANYLSNNKYCPKELNVKVEADNDFYSQRQNVCDCIYCDNCINLFYS